MEQNKSIDPVLGARGAGHRGRRGSSSRSSQCWPPSLKSCRGSLKPSPWWTGWRIPIRCNCSSLGHGGDCSRSGNVREEVNDRHGRDSGGRSGPPRGSRPVYAAADIVLGMGASAIKAMAFSKALVVQGEAGFWKTARPRRTSEGFLHDGGSGTKVEGSRTWNANSKPSSRSRSSGNDSAPLAAPWLRSGTAWREVPRNCRKSTLICWHIESSDIR